MADFSFDLRDVRFNLYEFLDVLELTKNPKFGDYDQELFDMTLDNGFRLAKEVIGPLNEPTDKEGCHHADGAVTMPQGFKEAYAKFCEGGWTAPTASAEWGGQGLPASVGLPVGEMMIAACCSFSFTPGLTRGAGNVIAVAGSDEQKARYLEKMYSGAWAGTMCLTEAQAGSAVGDIRTKAKPLGDGKYLIEGEKIFITSGDHDLTENIIHLVLARVEGAEPGFKGLSQFIVPKMRVNDDGSLGESNDVTCARIEEKMGIHASSTCTMVFGEKGKCEAEILGEEGQGLPIMFNLMNEARIGVGLQGVALAAAAYEQARIYAFDRVQGVDITQMRDVNAPRVPIVEHPDVKRMLLEMKAIAEGGRALLLKTAHYADRIETTDDEAEKEKLHTFTGMLTPICKAYCTDQGFRATELGIQVLAGFGYCQDYPLEQYCRDVKIASIYEGTNGIQALDLLGRKVSRKGGMDFMTFMQEFNSWIEPLESHEVVGEMVKKVQAGRDAMGACVLHFGQSNMNKDLYYPVYCATPFLELFGHVVVGALLVAHAGVAADKLKAILDEAGADSDEKKAEVLEQNGEAAFYHNKVQTAAFFVANKLNEVDGLKEMILGGDRSGLDVVFPAP